MPRIHQALHGYDKGHRELAASLDLGVTARQAMLVLSDLSGPRAARGFDSYLTAYPVPGSDYYAVAKTWLAPEMPRPGCVWTHTLLVTRTSVGQVRLGDLQTRFVRPHGLADKSLFARPLEFRSHPRTRPQLVHPLLPSLVEAVYGSPFLAVIMESDDRASLEEAVTLLWDGQPLPLKGRFAFSTGSLAPRSAPGVEFDLQVVPTSLSQGRELRVLNAGRRRPEPWARRMAYELAVEPGVIDEIGRDVRAGTRREVALVASAVDRAASAEASREIEAVIRGVDADDGAFRDRLVVTLLAHSEAWPHASAADRLLALLRAGASRDHVGLAKVVNELSQQATAVSPADMAQILRAAGPFRDDPSGQAVVRGLKLDDLRGYLLQAGDADDDTVLDVVRARPICAALPELWRSSTSTVAALISAVREGLNQDEGVLDAVLDSILVSRSANAIRLASVAFGTHATRSFLAGLDAGRANTGWPSALLDAIASHEGATLDWLASHRPVSDETLRAVAMSLPFSAARELGRDAGQWLPLRYDPNLRVASFLLAIGLQANDQDGLTLVLDSFRRVNRAAATVTLEDDAWAVLDPVLPSLGFLRDWNRCERLRRGVAMAFIRNSWPMESYFALADRYASRSELKHSLREIGGRAACEC